MSTTSLVRKLADLLEETGLTEIEFEAGEQRIRVDRGGSTVVQAPRRGGARRRTSRGAAAAPSEGPPAGAVTSPMVGTAYAVGRRRAAMPSSRSATACRRARPC